MPEPVYDLLIVEDDAEIRDVLSHYTLWSRLGFRVAGVAASAEEALALAYNQPFDVMMTDIRMREISGLDLIERLRRLYPGMLHVILSGYSEFEYARRALDLNVTAYLTKPVAPDQLAAAFRNVAEQLRQKNQWHSSVRLSQQAVLLALLENKIQAGYIQSLLPVLELDTAEGAYQLLMLEGEDMGERADLRGLQTGAWRSVLLNGRCLCLFRESEPLDPRALRDRLPQGVRGALSRRAPGLEQLSLRYGEAMAALDSLYFSGELIAQTTRPPAPRALPQRVGAAVQRVRTACERLDDQELAAGVGQLEALLGEHAQDAQQARGVLARLAGELCPGEAEKAVAAAPTLAAATAALRALGAALLADKRAQLSRARKSLSEQAKEYVEENLGSKLSLNELAGALYVNPSYLSRVFKKETKLSLNYYISERKMEKACEYLSRANIGIYEVAQRLGFSDYAYFCVLFKKHTGETPLSYRKRILYGTGNKA